MFVAMNRFKVNPGYEHVFEQRQGTNLARVPGFLHFMLLRGDEPGVYINHTVWESREAFEAWVRSDAFRAAHANPMPEGTLAAHPQASFYQVLLAEGSLTEGD